MLVKEVKINNKNGMHARPVALFSKCAQGFNSRIMIEKGEKSAYADSVLKIMLLQARYGDVVRITAEGDDEEEAISALTELIESGFGED